MITLLNDSILLLLELGQSFSRAGKSRYAKANNGAILPDWKSGAKGPNLRAILESIRDKGEPGVRQLQLSGAFTCRLERLASYPGYLAGEMMRIRSTDLPCEVHPDGTRELNVGVPIGDGVAFWFRESDHKLAIQYDAKTLSPGKFNDYIGQMVQGGQFVFEPAIDSSALARFRAQPLRKLKVKIARPQHLGVLESDMVAAGQAFRELGRRLISAQPQAY